LPGRKDLVADGAYEVVLHYLVIGLRVVDNSSLINGMRGSGLLQKSQEPTIQFIVHESE
jgi:hypothetical protein